MALKLSRRDFLKSALAAGSSVALLKPGDATAAEPTDGYPDRYGCLTDLTRCVGCRSCEAACNEANKLPKPDQPFDDTAVLKETRRPTAKAYTVVNQYPNPKGGEPIFRKIQCNHCNEPACASACLVKAYTKTPEGAVVYDPDICLGCRYCMLACPFYVPAYEYDNAFSPRIRKCTMCHERVKAGGVPACVEACPTETLIFGKRRDLLRIARERIDKEPGKYVDHIYGEHEAGGTSWLYLSPVPFDQVGFKTNVGEKPYPELTRGFLSAVPLVLTIWPALLGGFYLFSQNRHEASGDEPSGRHEEEKRP
jgi:Fe-S-cluster-containing dehydrogenase component